MNLKELVTGSSGEKQFLLGNEAAVRGVIEAGWLNMLISILSFPLMKKLLWKLLQLQLLLVLDHLLL